MNEQQFQGEMARDFELEMVKRILPDIASSCKINQEQQGKGCLVLKMNMGGQMERFWRKPTDFPDKRLDSLAAHADAKVGSLVVIIIYPHRMAAYAFSINTAPSIREFTGLDFFILDEHSVWADETHEPKPATTILRPSDMADNDDDFL